MKRYWWVLAIAIVGFAVAQTANYHAVATSKHIMAGIQKPSMDALAALNKAGGPKDDKEWAEAAQHAALLAESAQLLLASGRPKDQDVWLKTSTQLDQASTAALKAAEAKDLTAWKAAITQMGGACRGCHNVHKKKKAE